MSEAVVRTTGQIASLARPEMVVHRPYPLGVAHAGEADFKADSVLIGSGGVVTLTFTGVAPGEAHLKLVYHKSWEADVSPLEEFNITIHVK